MNDVTKDMSPVGAAIFDCFRSGDPLQQLSVLNNLTHKQLMAEPVNGIGRVDIANVD